MGKRLIIKGADFSSVAVDKESVDVTNILAHITLGYNVNQPSNYQPDRASLSFGNALNLTSYKEQGYSKVTIKPLEGIDVFPALCPNNGMFENLVYPSSEWLSDAVTYDIRSYDKVCFGLRLSSDEELINRSQLASDWVVVELRKA